MDYLVQYCNPVTHRWQTWYETDSQGDALEHRESYTQRYPNQPWRVIRNTACQIAADDRREA